MQSQLLFSLLLLLQPCSSKGITAVSTPTLPCITFFLWFTISSFFGPVSSQQVDDTIVEFTKGSEVTEAVVRKIIRSQIFTEDYGFLLRLAYVESKFGERDYTYRDEYFGGIWQVDKNKLERTQDTQNETLWSILRPIHDSISTHFNIYWMSVKWEELVKPLYSGLAARIFIAISESLYSITIPEKINRQAYFWHDFYNFGVYEIDSKFRQESRFLQDNIRPCRTKLDLVIAMDGSTSIGRDNFTRFASSIGTFLEKTFDQNTLQQTRIGVFIFSNLSYYLFDLESGLSLSKMKSVVAEAKYPFGDTDTARAMLYGTKMLKDASSRNGVPQILLLFQEGQSSVSIQEAAATVVKNNITTIAIGIGADVNQTELIEIGLGEKMNVFNLEGFASLQDFFLRLSPVLCTIAQRPLVVGDVYMDSLVFGEQRFYVLEIPNDSGVTIFVTMVDGSTRACWSYDEKVPSAVVHDGEIDGVTYIPPYKCDIGRKKSIISATSISTEFDPQQEKSQRIHKDGESECRPFPQKVYVTVEGIAANNILKVYSKIGDHDVCDDCSSSSNLNVFPGSLGCFLLILLIYRLWGIF